MHRLYATICTRVGEGVQMSNQNRSNIFSIKVNKINVFLENKNDVLFIHLIRSKIKFFFYEIIK